MPHFYHELPTNFVLEIQDKIAEIPGHTKASVTLVGATRYPSSRIGFGSKEPDQGLRPASRGPHPALPSLVIEVGYSQTRSDLWEAGDWWHENTSDFVRFVILIKVKKNRLSWKFEYSSKILLGDVDLNQRFYFNIKGKEMSNHTPLGIPLL